MRTLSFTKPGATLAARNDTLTSIIQPRCALTRSPQQACGIIAALMHGQSNRGRRARNAPTSL